MDLKNKWFKAFLLVISFYEILFWNASNNLKGEFSSSTSCETTRHCQYSSVCHKSRLNHHGICTTVSKPGEVCDGSQGPVCSFGECERNRCRNLWESKSMSSVDGRTPLTTYKCTNAELTHNPDAHRSCEFRNLYYLDGKWTMLLDSKEKSLPPYLKVRSKHENIYNFGHIRNDDPEFVSRLEKRKLETHRGVHVYFKQPWCVNIGHALFDGLYAAWVALVVVGREKISQFTIIVNKNSTSKWKFQADYVFKKFGGTNRFYDEHELLSPSAFHRFDVVVMGTSGKGQRWMTKDLKIPGAEFNAPKLFRNRMYSVFGVKMRKWSKRNRTDIKTIIVHNKRYDHREVRELINLTYVGKSAGFNIDYIDWSSIGEYPNNFGEHLRILSRTDVYISGPGTGMMYAPFLPDKAIFVALGTWQESNGDRFVAFMEQNVVEGCSFLMSLYYPSSLRPTGIKLQIVAGLYDTALDIVQKGFRIPVKPGLNLSPEGQVFREACLELPTECSYVLDAANGINNLEGCVYYGWADCMVYEVGAFKANKLYKDTPCMPWKFREKIQAIASRRRDSLHDLSTPCKDSVCPVDQIQSHIAKNW